MYRPIFYTLTGSRLYGTDREDSDHDFRGVVLGNKATYLGELTQFQQTDDIEKVDLPIKDKERIIGTDMDFYEAGRFIKLAWDANPNIIELLFAPNLLIFNDDNKNYAHIWHLIMEHREHFISQKALHTFSGYAHAQIRKLKNKVDWIADGEAEMLPRHQYDSIETYKKAKLRHKNYQTWLKERNPARLKLELRYGFDTKYVMHIVRLFYECQRLLTTGELVFPLPEAEELKSILHGAWTYEKIIEFSDEMDEKLNSIKTTLPKHPDRKKLDKLIQSIRHFAIT